MKNHVTDKFHGQYPFWKQSISAKILYIIYYYVVMGVQKPSMMRRGVYALW